MDTYWDKYRNDPQFHDLVDTLTAYIMQTQFTPSEIRAAAMMASINFEHLNLHRTYIVDKSLEDGLRVIEENMFNRKEYAEEA